MSQSSQLIEIPLIILKTSFAAKERQYKCTTCGEVLDRLYKYEDHYEKHFYDGNNAKGLVEFDHGCYSLQTPNVQNEYSLESIINSVATTNDSSSIVNGHNNGVGAVGKKRAKKRKLDTKEVICISLHSL